MTSNPSPQTAPHPWRGILDLLACPASYQPLKEADPDLLNRVNEAIQQGRAIQVNGQPRSKLLEAALVREDQKVIYPVEQGILVLLEDEGIKWTP
jgi:uncharacterized protein YbaR (Trm112 family)